MISHIWSSPKTADMLTQARVVSSETREITAGVVCFTGSLCVESTSHVRIPRACNAEILLSSLLSWPIYWTNNCCRWFGATRGSCDVTVKGNFKFKIYLNYFYCLYLIDPCFIPLDVCKDWWCITSHIVIQFYQIYACRISILRRCNLLLVAY